jgi:mannose-6-phosphate isomerase-like protein (cupin superfamily)
VAAPIVIGPGGGEVVGDSPDRRVEILCDADALHTTWSRFGPGREGADLHVHRRHSDLFYVLAGELTVRLGLEDRAVAAPAGTLVRIPPLVVHGFRNAGDAEVRYLNFHAPGQGFADYMRAMRDGRTLVYDQEPPPADGGRPTSEVAVGAPGDVTDVEAVGVAELSAQPGDRVDSQWLYVLEGELGLGGLRAAAGSWVESAQGTVSQPVRFLDVRAPNASVDTDVRPVIPPVPPSASR